MGSEFKLNSWWLYFHPRFMTQHYVLLKGQFTPTLKFFHQMLTLNSIQTCIQEVITKKGKSWSMFWLFIKLFTYNLSLQFNVNSDKTGSLSQWVKVSVVVHSREYHDAFVWCCSGRSQCSDVEPRSAAPSLQAEECAGIHCSGLIIQNRIHNWIKLLFCFLCAHKVFS